MSANQKYIKTSVSNEKCAKLSKNQSFLNENA